MSLFLLTFLTIYFALNYYVLRRLYSLFKIKPRIGFYLLFVSLWLSFVLVKVLQSRFDNFLITAFDTIACFWMGLGLLLLTCLAAYEIINLFVVISRLGPVPKPLAGYIVSAAAIVLTIYSMINAMFINITTIDVPAPVNTDIVQLCDIHLGSTSNNFLKRVIKKTNALDPDAVLITGDLIDSRRELKAGALFVLNDLDAPVFLTTGNHERYAGIWQIEDFLKANTKVQFLRNEFVDFKGLQLIGIDDSDKKDQVAARLAELKLDPEKFSILMYHRPIGFAAAAEAGIDLMLTGHTHNGQIFPFNFFVRRSFPYTKGLFRKGNCLLYVSQGTGTWGPAMRLGSKNQITLLKLRKK
jgi:predicted MPP superfamily phosphohydrolase